ncbi:MAG: hypothetical protein COA78_37795 [Blastopirellula sp.]|nr:MAG: hypothetical protein COA78_37795 [Blastopirellula sp.]
MANHSFYFGQLRRHQGKINIIIAVYKFFTDSDSFVVSANHGIGATGSNYSFVAIKPIGHFEHINRCNKRAGSKHLFSPEQRERLIEVLTSRLDGIVRPENIVSVAADPREIEYVIESADGSTRSEWRKPKPAIEDLKAKSLEVLEQDGLALLALNAAMYSADKSDRIAALKVRIRNDKANAAIWTYAVVKSTAVAINPIPVADLLGGSTVDVAMVRNLAHIYGIDMNWANLQQLVTSILKAAGWVALGELTTHAISWGFNTLTLGWGKAFTMLPQGAAAGYGSIIVGRAAKYYFEHGASWGSEGPKTVVRQILDQAEKQSIIQQLKDEISKKLYLNRHAGDAKSSAK